MPEIYCAATDCRFNLSGLCGREEVVITFRDGGFVALECKAFEPGGQPRPLPPGSATMEGR